MLNFFKSRLNYFLRALFSIVFLGASLDHAQVVKDSGTQAD